MVNTFLPFSDFKKSVKCLDNKRCLKQIVEARQIVDTLEKIKAYKTSDLPLGKSFGWRKHPAVLMWVGYLPALKHYSNLCQEEWISRGKKYSAPPYEIKEEIILPWYIGWKEFHASHRASLMRKEPSFYYRKFLKITPLCSQERGYIWPIDKEMKNKLFSEIALPSYIVIPQKNCYLISPIKELSDKSKKLKIIII